MAGRRLIFASDEQLEIAARFRTSYGDGASQMAGEPFRQPPARHAFVRGARGSVAQAPLAFFLIGHRGRKGRAAVLGPVREFAPGAQPPAFEMDS